jgi:hypothetical protein
MTGTRRPLLAPAAWLPTLVLLGLLVAVWAATTGPVRMLRDTGRRLTFDTPTPPPETASSDQGPPNLREITKDVQPQFDLSWLGDLIAGALLLGVCLAALLALRWWWLHRWHRPEKPETVDFDVLPDAITEAMRADAQAQLEAVEQGSPRNGIVACWVRLQEILTGAGVAPRRSETSAEFVVRTLRSLDVDPRAIGALAALYREARFSDHELGEDRRTAARDALRALHEELRSRGAVA